MSVHVGYTVTDNTVPQGDSGPSTLRLTQSYTPTKSLQINQGEVIGPRGLLTRSVDACGYYRTGLYTENSKRINCRVHTLVAEAFIGPRPANAVTRRLDGNHLNNDPLNLRIRDAVRERAGHQFGMARKRNIRKTECPQGHPFDLANTGYGPAGNRICKTCRRGRERARRARMKEAA